MFSYCCNAKPDIEIRQLEIEINILKNTIDEKNEQINNIYEILETLTNESKNKFNNLDESNTNDVSNTEN